MNALQLKANTLIGQLQDAPQTATATNVQNIIQQLQQIISQLQSLDTSSASQAAKSTQELLIVALDELIAELQAGNIPQPIPPIIPNPAATSHAAAAGLPAHLV